MAAKEALRRLLRRGGLEVHRWDHAFPYRRLRWLRELGVEVLADVGANAGQYATEVRRGGYQGRLVSFEPVASVFATLARAAERDQRWDTVRTAVGPAPGRLSMQVSEWSEWSSPLPPSTDATSTWAGAATVAVEEVPVDRLDSLLTPYGAARTAVKVDVQGFEREVLLGAPDILARAVLWEMELSMTPLYEGQMLLPEALDRLGAAGLTLSAAEEIGLGGDGRARQLNGIFLRVDG